MDRFLQLHFLTAYPPANLNRDDTGRPKTAMLGGVPRLRVSSQALKRAWRTSEVFQNQLEGHLGKRTQRFGEEVERHLRENGVGEAEAHAVAREVADAFGKLKGTDDDPPLIEQLAFIGPEEQRAALEKALARARGELERVKSGDLLRKTEGAVDIAMFGRMLADDPDFNREAAVQVAHAITTHRALVEDDYYTAVDDLKRAEEDAGAGFIGEAGFGAGIFYGYVCVDRDLLVRNLGRDESPARAESLARAGIAALIEAAATVAPRGKQASFASRARASYILAERGDSAPRSLIAAFVPACNGADLLRSSIDAIEKTRAAFERAYGDPVEFSVLDVPGGKGTLAELVAFAQD